MNTGLIRTRAKIAKPVTKERTGLARIKRILRILNRKMLRKKAGIRAAIVQPAEGKENLTSLLACFVVLTILTV